MENSSSTEAFDEERYVDRSINDVSYEPTTVIDRWLKDQAEENDMDCHHLPFWNRLIELVDEKELRGKRILDFGCNNGGFLRALATARQIKSGIGVDIAQESVARANSLKGSLQIEYRVQPDLGKFVGNSFDTSFSYEVIYLLPDLRKHADDMFKVLSSGGSYYAATGCYTEVPFWPNCKAALLRDTSLIPYDYSLSDYRDAFSEAGFEVSARRLAFTEFVRVDLYPDYFPKVSDPLDYFEKYVVVFQFKKPR